MTSNHTLEDWGKLIGDVALATAILDRLIVSAEVIQITGKSYRLRGRTVEAKEDRMESAHHVDIRTLTATTNT